MMESPPPEAKSPAIPTIGVGGLVFNSKDQVLLIQRSRPPQAGLWHIPGGRLEPFESLKACCQREIFEETGIVALPGPIVGVADRVIEGFHYVVIDFLAQLAEGYDDPPIAASDAAAAQWVDLPCLGDYPLVEGIETVIASGAALHQGLSAPALIQSNELPWLFVSPNLKNDIKKQSE